MPEQRLSSAPEARRANPFVLIAGYGLPGRSLADRVKSLGIEYRVIEKNAITVNCAAPGTPIQLGDALDPAVLRDAGIGRATIFAALMPDEPDVLRCVQLVRGISSSVRIIARCTFVSGGLDALRRGADEVVVAEKVVAAEIQRSLEKLLVAGF